MSIQNIGNAPKNYAVLPFYATSAAFFLIWSVLLFLSESVFDVHYFNAHLLAVVHIAALGWGTMTIFGAAYQLIPVISEQNLYSSTLALISYCFLTLGTVLIAYSFWFFIMDWHLILGGALILIAALLYSYNVLKTIRIFTLFSWERLFLFSSALWLITTVVIGLLLAFNFKYPFFTSNHLEILKLHAHAGLAGWFLQLITGVSIRLMPMFLLGKSTKNHLIKVSFILQNAGLLLFLLDGYLEAITYRSLIYAALIGAGIICWLLYIIDVYKKRLKKKIDIPMSHSLWSLIYLIVAIGFIPFVYFGVNMKWTFVYGVFLFMGWISSLILGMTFKTLPFIVWNNHYKNLHGKGKIPMPKDLYSPRMLKIQFWFFVIAIYVLALSLIVEQPLFLKIALGIWIFVPLFYVINVVKILTHKTKIDVGNSH